MRSTRAFPRRLPLLVPVLLLAALSGCAATPPPAVAVTGDEAGMARLDGEWAGDYWSGSTGRRGSIRFKMQSDAHAAWGDVWMSPAPHEQSAAEAGRAPVASGAAPLQIRFVRVGSEGVVSGTLEPYPDPGCSCMVSTTFHGTLEGDTLRGTYTTRGPRGHAETGGQWQARRVAATPTP